MTEENSSDEGKEKIYTFIVNRLSGFIISYSTELYPSNIDDVAPGNHTYFCILPEDEREKLEKVDRNISKKLFKILEENPEINRVALEVKIKSSEEKKETPN